MMYDSPAIRHYADTDRVPIAAILQMLDARGANDRLAAVAARIIRSQEVTILSLDNEVVEAEWRAIAHAAEISRISDHRRAWDERRANKGARP